ncbi:MAG: hypothetical protein IH845_03115 [Nanoarchaeota archaeon]|nr:hypothetical protein [Nanoarchaeota archaeon]
MKKFDQDEIKEWKNTFTERGYPQIHGKIDGREISYFVMPKKLFVGPSFKEIPNGLFRMTGLGQSDYLIGVSEQVLDKIQLPFALSEHDEFIVYGLKDLNRTIHTEENMQRVLQEDTSLRLLYNQNKLELYDHLLTEANENLKAWGFTREDYAGFQVAANFLKEQL